MQVLSLISHGVEVLPLIFHEIKVLYLISYEIKVFTIDVRCGNSLTVSQLMAHMVKVLSLM